MLLTSPKPPLTYFSFFRIVPAWSTAAATLGSLNGMLVGRSTGRRPRQPASRSIRSSIQSVAGQPVASPDSMPAHHGLMPARRDRVAQRDQLVPRGGDLPALLREHLRRVPDEGLHVGAERRAVELAADGGVLRASPRGSCSSAMVLVSADAGLSLPASANRSSRPGCGTKAMSGALPPSTRTWIWASNSPLPSYSISMPVQSSNCFQDSSSRSASASRMDE